MLKGFVFIGLILCTASACVKKSRLSDTPQISFLKIINDTISYDSLNKEPKQFMLSFSYQVKNANINAKDSTLGNFILTDLRNGANNYSFALPKFANPIKKYDSEIGTIDIVIDAEKYQIDLGKDMDSIAWQVILIDNKGDTSNTITTDFLYLTK